MHLLNRIDKNFFLKLVPGVSEYMTNSHSYRKTQSWMRGLDNDDMALLICKF